MKNKNHLTFEKLRKLNKKRCEKYFHPINDWSETDWATALAGEVGEACNFIKKRKRGENIDKKEVGKELADIIMYTDLLATKFGFKLEDLVKEKFNEVSDRKKCKLKL